MVRPRPPYLNRETTRHGGVKWYFRRYPGPRILLRSQYGSSAFWAEYAAARDGEVIEAPKPAAGRRGSLAWLFDRYRESAAWCDLSAATRRQREYIIAGVLNKSGGVSFAQIAAKDIEAGKDARRDTPAQARNFLDAMRGLFRWALAADYIEIDPTANVKNPKRARRGEGFPVWSDDDLARYEARWPLGTRERVWLAVLLYTGLRRGDAVRLGRQHIRGGVAVLKTEKSGYEVELALPILPALAEAIKAGPVGDLALICGEGGGPLTKESFGNAFAAAARAAGVAKSCHGVRKAGATRAANAGATVAELEAIFGWSGGGMASLYTRSADRRRLAVGAMSKLG